MKTMVMGASADEDVEHPDFVLLPLTDENIQFIEKVSALFLAAREVEPTLQWVVYSASARAFCCDCQAAEEAGIDSLLPPEDGYSVEDVPEIEDVSHLDVLNIFIGGNDFFFKGMLHNCEYFFTTDNISISALRQ